MEALFIFEEIVNFSNKKLVFCKRYEAAFAQWHIYGVRGVSFVRNLFVSHQQKFQNGFE
jgi:hypothetical protein